jgi:hypothetical protein
VPHEQQVAGFELVQQQRQRRHARRRDDRTGPTFEVGECSSELVARRVARPRVVVGALLPEAKKREVRRQDERRRHGAVRGVRADRGAHGARRGGEGFGLHRCTSSTTDRST